MTSYTAQKNRRRRWFWIPVALLIAIAVATTSCQAVGSQEPPTTNHANPFTQEDRSDDIAAAAADLAKEPHIAAMLQGVPLLGPPSTMPGDVVSVTRTSMQPSATEFVAEQTGFQQQQMVAGDADLAAALSAVLGEDPHSFATISAYNQCLAANYLVNQQVADKCLNDEMVYVATIAARTCLGLPACKMFDQVAFLLQRSVSPGDLIGFLGELIALYFRAFWDFFGLCAFGGTIDYDRQANDFYIDDDIINTFGRLVACFAAAALGYPAFMLIVSILKWFISLGGNGPRRSSPYSEVYWSTTTPEASAVAGIIGPPARDVQNNMPHFFSCVQVGVMQSHFGSC